jgi:hypothetical protein
MEDHTAFVLEHAIANWRQHLGQSPSYRAENLTELESHLRDSVASLTSRGLTDEEAFLVGARRMGTMQALEPEFTKVNGREIWLRRLLWMLVGIQAYGLLSALSGALSRTGSQFLMVSLMRPGAEAIGADAAFLGSPISIAGSALFFFADLVTLATVAAVSWWPLRRNKDRAGQWARGRGGLVVGAVVFCVAMIVCVALGQVNYALLARSASPATVGKIALSASMANLVLHPLKIIALAALTVWLARRQIRRVAA